MERIAVIGGSLAGLEFANTLKGLDHHNDFEIHLFEEHPTIGQPLRCAEGLILFHDLPAPNPNVVLNEIDTVLVRFLDNELRILDTVAIQVQGKAWLIDRPLNERILAASCKERGIDLSLGQRVSISEISGSYDFVVDASGWPSEYGALLGAKSLPPSIGVGGEIASDFSAFNHHFIIDFSPLFPGYFWIFPKNRNLANVGLGWHTSGPYLSKPKALLSRYLNSKLKSWHLKRAIAGCLGTNLARSVYDSENRVALIGDAGGFANPLVGEGMSSAIMSARVLASCFSSGDLTSYPSRVRTEIERPHQIGFAARRVFERLSYDMFRKAFLSIDEPSLELLDSSLPHVVSKIAQHPLVLAQLTTAYLRYKTKKTIWRKGSLRRDRDSNTS